MTVRVLAEDDGAVVRVAASGRPLRAEGAWWAGEVPLPAGADAAEVEVVATDAAGNAAREVVRVAVDRIPPEAAWRLVPPPAPGGPWGVDADVPVDTRRAALYLGGWLLARGLPATLPQLDPGPRPLLLLLEDHAGNLGLARATLHAGPAGAPPVLEAAERPQVEVLAPGPGALLVPGTEVAVAVRYASPIPGALRVAAVVEGRLVGHAVRPVDAAEDGMAWLALRIVGSAPPGELALRASLVT